MLSRDQNFFEFLLSRDQNFLSFLLSRDQNFSRRFAARVFRRTTREKPLVPRVLPAMILFKTLKWYYDQKNNSFFSLDFISMLTKH